MRNFNPTARLKSRAAFTLIELVAVIGIILMMSLVITGAYVGMSRAIAARVGINHLRNAVMIARQHACMDGQRTYLYILNETEYVICRRAGRVSADAVSVTINVPDPSSPDRVTSASAYHIKDEYTDLDSYVNVLDRTADGLTIYNFDSDHHQPYATVLTIEPFSEGGWSIFVKKTSRFSMDPQNFKSGDIFGIEIYSRRSLPRGYTFVNGSPFTPIANYFEPTGEPGGRRGKFTDIKIVEAVRPNLVQSVSVRNGKIVVDTAGTEN